jgi:peroxiredoxin
LLQLQQQQKDLKKLNAVSIAVSVESAATSEEFRKKHTLTYPILSDPDFVATDKYKVRAGEEGFALPALFLIDKAGTIRLGRVGVAHGPFEAEALTQALELLRKPAKSDPPQAAEGPADG